MVWMHEDLELIGGPEHRKIILHPYADAWPGLFQAHATQIHNALGGEAVRVEHIGSTSIPRLMAKPIIDIQVSVHAIEDETTYLLALESAGYQLRVREPGHRMVRTPALDTHVHICQVGSDWERRPLLFRDYLRHSEPDRLAYVELKKTLATEDWGTMNHYADAKSTLIGEIMARAEIWAHKTNWNIQEAGASDRARL